jgi:hypothetical protein
MYPWEIAPQKCPVVVIVVTLKNNVQQWPNINMVDIPSSKWWYFVRAPVQTSAMSGKSFSQDDAWIQMLSAPFLQPPYPMPSHKATQLRQGQNVCRHADRQLPQCNLTFFFLSLLFLSRIR